MSEWSMSDERAFLENLLCQRFNFFLTFFSIIIGGAVASLGVNPWISVVILGIGLTICILMAETIKRSQYKLDLIIDERLRTENKKHPAIDIDDLARTKLGKNKSRRKIIGYHIPNLCNVILMLLLFASIALLYLNIKI